MSVFKYKNTSGTPMVRMVADYGYQLTKDGHNFHTVICVPAEDFPLWREVKVEDKK